MKSLSAIFLLLASFLFCAAAPASAKTVVLDAGHGGIDRGGIPRQRYSEKAVALDVTQRVSAILKSKGYKVVMTRSNDTFIGLNQRCAISNKQSGCIFVSIHTNSDPRGTGIGIETYYYSRAGARLGSAIHKEVVRAAGTPDRRLRSRGLYVLRHNKKPSCLVEIGFLTNAIEGPRLAQSSAYRQKIAVAIAKGICSAY